MGDPVRGNWCNGDAVATSLLEATSLVTPLLESFVIRSVLRHAATLDAQNPQRPVCQAFVREEAWHSRLHGGLNADILAYLGRRPPGHALLAWLFRAASRLLSAPSCLLLSAVVEHVAAVASRDYLRNEAQLRFGRTSARQVFRRHASDELGHRAVVFDLWQGTRQGARAGRAGRLLATLAVLLGCLAYVAAAVPWIVYRKRGGRLAGALRALCGFLAVHRTGLASLRPLADVMAIVRADFHPDLAIHGRPAAGG